MKTTIALFLFLICSNVFAGDATVIKIRGENISLGKTLQTGDTIKEGQEVELKDKNSLLQIRFTDGSRVLLKQGVYKVEKPVDPEGNFLRMVRGTIFVDKAKGKAPFSVVTKSSVMGVRGTKFFVDQTDETYLCVCEGEVEISNAAGKIKVSKNEDVKTSSNKKLEKHKATDDMMNMALSGFKDME